MPNIPKSKHDLNNSDEIIIMFGKKEIYLDYNATTPIADTVKTAMVDAMDLIGNPSSVHGAGRKAKKVIEDSRIKISALAGCRPRDIVFTSGGTEANNLALRGAPVESYIISPLEHEAILSTAKDIEAQGKPVSYLNVKSDGQIDMDHLRELLEASPKPALVSVMMVNNEIGLVQDLKTIIDLAHEHGALIHSDAVQAAGKMMVSASDLDIDYMSLSAHKIYGPKGIGALILKPTAPLKAQITGGGQELGRRSGTENLVGIVGFGEAALVALENLADLDRQSVLRNSLEGAIRQHANDAIIVGDKINRTANVSCIAMPNVNSETQVMHMDLMGICVSSGSACSSGKVKTSHVLTALGYDQDTSNNSIRISLGSGTTSDDVEEFVKAWCTLYDRKKGQ